MKLVCDREELSSGLQSVLRSVGARAGIPALSGVLLELTDQELWLTTTDLELTTRVRLDLTGEAGRVLVPARLLADMVRNLDSDQVELVAENGSVRVAGGRFQAEIRALAPEDFPRVEPVAETKTLELEGEVLAKAFSQVAPATSRDETRPVLTGVLLEGRGDELRVVATDSYRLALRTLPAAGVGDTTVLVPGRAVAEVGRLATGDVRVEVSSSHVGFHVGDTVIQSRLIEGEFPPYEKLIPEGLTSRLTITKGPFVESLKRVAILAHDATHVFLELSSETIRISCHAQGLGEAAEEIDGSYVGDEVRVAFNPGYLETGVMATTSEEVVMELDDAQRPVLIHAPEDREYLYLLMPIRVS